MKYYNDQIETCDSVVYRLGDPEEWDACLGQVVQAFAFLERTISNVIKMMLGVPDDIGDIITAELSYRNKLDMFSSLLRYNVKKYKDFDEDIETRFRELLSLCSTAGGQRNRIIHSDFAANKFRLQITAKARHGLQKRKIAMKAKDLLDIADFIASIGMYVESFPMNLGLADICTTGGYSITYTKRGVLVRKFDFL